MDYLELIPSVDSEFFTEYAMATAQYELGSSTYSNQSIRRAAIGLLENEGWLAVSENRSNKIGEASEYKELIAGHSEEFTFHINVVQRQWLGAATSQNLDVIELFSSLEYYATKNSIMTFCHGERGLSSPAIELENGECCFVILTPTQGNSEVTEAPENSISIKVPYSRLTDLMKEIVSPGECMVAIGEDYSRLVTFHPASLSLP